MTFDELSETVAQCLSEFQRARVLVLGDAIVDEYLQGECGRISPEAPVPVVRVTSTRRVLGGAANTAANVASLGGHVRLIAGVGNDEGGATLRHEASRAGIELLPVNAGRPTLRKTRVVSQQQQIVRLDHEEADSFGDEPESQILAAFDAHVRDADIVVISDYAKGFVTERVASEVIVRSHAAGVPVIIDPRPQHKSRYVGCDFLTPNWKEACALLGVHDHEPTPTAVAEVARRLAGELRSNIVLTLGPHGILFCDRNGTEMFSQPTMAREVFDVSGAGDTVVAAFALAQAAGASHRASLAIANKAASVVVGKFGTATVSQEELLNGTPSARLIARAGLGPLAAGLRSKGKRIVTVNGCFDILHSGHLYLLNEARNCGDVLVVGINSDASVRGLKGPGRPAVSERQRAEMLLALRMVDYVHIFDEPNPIAFLREIRPDIHVNGAEYGEQCVEAETVRSGGGRLHLVNRLPGLSTSAIVEALAKPAVG